MSQAVATAGMTGEQMVALCKQHSLYEWSAQSAVDPIPVARAKGIYFWTPEDKRYIDFNSQLMCVNAGHGHPAIIKAIQDQAAIARLHQPVHGQRSPGPARRQARRDHARRHGRVLLHQRRRRGQRERDPHRPRGHRPPQDPGPLPLVPRRHRRQPDAHRRSAPLGGRAGHSRRGPRARPVSRHGARLGHRRTGAALPRRGDRARGPEAHRRLHPRDDQRHQRHPRAARRLPAGRAGAVRQARHPADLRRGDGRVRPDRHVVRRRSLERRPRPDDHGQGPDQRLRAARRGRHAAEHRRTLQGEGLQRGTHLQQPPARLRDRTGHHQGLRRRGDDRERAHSWAR